MKSHAPGCGVSDCCGCTEPPDCTLTGSGGGTPGTDITLTWTTSGADTVTIVDSDGATISNDLNGTSVTVAGGACKAYTLAATNDCGTSYCVYGNSCPASNCSYCEHRTYPTSFTVQLTNNGKINNCSCSAADATAKCAEFNGTFAVTGQSSCEWRGGPFGEDRCLNASFNPRYRAWTLRLKVSPGAWDGSDSGSLYAKLDIFYSVIDPNPCQEIGKWEKKLSDSTARVDCESLIPGVYSLASSGTLMCDVDVEIV